MNVLVFLPLGVIGPWQWVIIALIIILLFGGKKIPELMRGLGKGMKEFKKGMNDVEKDINDIDKDLNSTAKEPDKIEKIEEKRPAGTEQ